MKLHPLIQTKHTTKLFNNKYKFKIVLKTKAAGWFRGGNLENVKEKLISPDKSVWAPKITKEDRDYVSSLITAMGQLVDYDLRVESPLISFYTNTEKNIEKLAKVNPSLVKYVSFPRARSESLLDEHKIISKTINYDYRVTMGRTRQNYSNFLNWCTGKELKIKLPKRAKTHLAKEHSWGGYYFYVSDEKTLTMVKIFVGSAIHSVETVVKQ